MPSLEPVEGNPFAPKLEPVEGNPFETPPLTGAEGGPPPIPQAFTDRVAQGRAIGDMLDKLSGSSGDRFQSFPERIARSGFTLAKNIKDGLVISGPGLRKEDFSDDPSAPEPLDTLIQRTVDMAAAQLGQTAFSRIPAAGPLLDTGEGRFARPYSDAEGTMRA